MSSSDNARTPRIGVSKRVLPVLAVGITLVLGGCFRPLYGPTASGKGVAAELASVDIVIASQVAQERPAHYLEQELRFALNGSRPQPVKAYRLELSISQQVLTASVNQTTGQAVAAILRMRANYKLVQAGSTTVLTAGTATTTAGYDRNPQRFANLRAARDAEIRASKEMAEQLQTRLAGWFASRN